MPVEPRPFAEVREEMLARARQHRNPFHLADPARVEEALGSLDSVDRDRWAEAFSALAAPHEERARVAEQAGDAETAAAEYLLAYEYWHVARYPAPNSPKKREAYRVSQESYRKAARAFDPPVERVEIPFASRPGEGDHAVGLLRVPRSGSAPRPVVVIWGGIDSFKEERRTEPYLAAGFATLAVDMPGVADAPLAGSEDAERLWDAFFDWIPTRGDLDPDRIAIVGGSTGGYWAAKLAHTHRDRIRCAVDQGGPAHYAFEADWIARAQRGEYPFELAETLACAFGRSTYDDWVAYAPRLSLLDQGILDRPCAPLLLINGVRDSVFPIQDMYLLLEHGDPKMARFYPDSGHMGGAQAQDVIVAWLIEQLA